MPSVPQICPIGRDIFFCWNVHPIYGKNAEASYGWELAIQGKLDRKPSTRWLARLSDDALIAELQSGNTDAFAVIFDRFHRLVLVTALRVIRDAGEAEDVTQQVFLEVYPYSQKTRSNCASGVLWPLQMKENKWMRRLAYVTGLVSSAFSPSIKER